MGMRLVLQPHFRHHRSYHMTLLDIRMVLLLDKQEEVGAFASSFSMVLWL